MPPQMADLVVHECIAQVATAQLCPTIVSPVRCTPAAVRPIHPCTPLHRIKRRAVSSCHRRWQLPAVHECIAQLSTGQLCPTIVSPVRCTPAAVRPIHPWNARSLDQAPSCFVVPPRMADLVVHECIAQVSTPQLPPHDRVTCALHTRGGATRSPLYRLFTGSSAELFRRATADGRSLRYTSALHRSQQPNSAPRSCHLCAAHPPRCDPFTPVTPLHRIKR